MLANLHDHQWPESAKSNDTREQAAVTIEDRTVPRPRSKAWVYYTVLAVLSFIALCTGQLGGLLGTALFGVYAVYLYRGGRVVFWFW